MLSASAPTSSAATPTSPTQKFLDEIDKSIKENTFVRASLNQPKQSNDNKAQAQKVQARLVEGKGGTRRLQVVTTFPTNTITKMYDVDQSSTILGGELEKTFRSARLFTTQADIILDSIDKKTDQQKIQKTKPTFTSVESLSHDKPKKRRLSLMEVEDTTDPLAAGGGGRSFLIELGILNASTGQPKAGMRDKFRQIEKFVEIMEGLIKSEKGLAGGEGTQGRSIGLLDGGCGKGYLTFAAYEYLQRQGFEVRATGVDIRQDVVDKANAVAVKVGYTSLHFIQGSIEEWSSLKASHLIDVLVALHACDTATDNALYLAIKLGAKIIITSPCCHKEVRREMRKAAKSAADSGSSSSSSSSSSESNILKPITRHGILEERQCEIVTDAIRALLLELVGYSSQVFEFIDNSHTSKNLMLVGVKRNTLPSEAEQKRLKQEVVELMHIYNVQSQHLARLLDVL